MRKLRYFIILTLVFISALAAQLPALEVIGEPEKLDDEIVSRRDANGHFCAVLKVISDIEGLAYDSYNGILGEIQHNPGQDLVYVQPDERVLQVFATGYEPLKIILSQYGVHLQAKETWRITISGEKILKDVPIVIIVKPEGAEISIDGVLKGTGNQHLVKEGSHQIRITREGFQPIIETIFADGSHTLFRYELQEVEDVALEIYTTPADAVVYIDNLRIGSTPTSTFYPAGRYPIRIKKEWYITYDDFIDIKAPKMKRTYDLMPDFGSITVTSAPESGLEILIDNISRGFSTPHTFEKLKPGTYEIRGKSPYFDTDIQELTLKRGDQASVQLVTIENFATLTINTDDQSSVLLNGEKLEDLKNIRLEPMLAVIEVHRSKAETLTRRITLKRGEQLTLDLFPEIMTGTLLVTVKPLDANIELTGDDGEHYTSEGMYNFKDIPIGNYTLKVERSGYESQIVSLNLKQGDKLKQSIQLVERVQPEPIPGMIFIKGGSFKMGCSIWAVDCEFDEKPAHTVTVSDFYMSATEVTQKQWIELIGSNPSYFKGDDLPVENVSWNDVQEFLRKLNLKTGGSNRLPTEAEWEYAARGGGEKIKWAGTGSAEELGKYAWYAENSSGITQPVGTKKPNKLGLYDMSGNVWEWCSDWYASDYYKNSIPTNPTGPAEGTNRVVRGGSWGYYQKYVRCGFRGGSNPSSHYSDLGFRLVR